MSSTPSDPQPTPAPGAVEEGQVEQPINPQPEGESDHAPVTSQPTSAEQQAPPTGTETAPDSSQSEGTKDHLAVISEKMETSK